MAFSVRVGRFLPMLLLCVAQHIQANPLVADVARFEVTGNTLLPESRIQEALSGLGGQLTLFDIETVAQKLQDAYRQAGYGAVVVQVPEQVVSSGAVKLEVIEGRLSQIQVAGIHEFSRENIMRSLPALALNTTPSLAELDSELLMANENPAKTVRVVFQPGEKKAQVEALVSVQEQEVERWQASLDNTGNDATGRYRLALSYQNANLLDSDSVLGLRYATSPSHPSQVGIFSSTLRVPLYPQKTFLEFSLLASNTRNTPNQTPAGELRFSGEGVSVGARALWTLPSLGEFKHQASIGLESRRYNNSCTLGDFGSAGCGTAAASVEVLPATLGYSIQKPGKFQALAQWVSNLAVERAGNDADFNAARPGAVSRYSLARGNASGLQALSTYWTLSWRAEAQWSEQPLVSAEQQGAGGASSVRGYPERAVAGDSGFVGSLELRTPLSGLMQAETPSQNVYVSLFLDAAKVSNQREAFCMAGRASCSLWGGGAGVLWRPAKNTTVRFDLARAGETVNDTQMGDWRAHFSLIYTL